MSSTEAIENLINGYKEFKERYIHEENASYLKWASVGQSPKVMIIACSDSRVNPAILTHAGLGELFMVNNVANLVPPFKKGKDTHHSTSSAVEFAVKSLEIEHIIVMGHSKCGGIKALMEGNTTENDNEYSFIAPWMDIVADAKEDVKSNNKDLSAEEQNCLCEKKAILISLQNLMTFPWVKSAVDNNKLSLHAWYFELSTGILSQYEDDKGEFTDVLS